MPDFTELLDELNVAHRPGSKPSEIYLCCPFCSDRGESEDTKFRLGVNVAYDTAHCFNCEYASRKNSQLWILRKLGAHVNAVEADDDTEQEEVEALKLPDDFQLLTEVCKSDELGVMAVKFALKRGLTSKQISKHRIGCSFSGRFAYRLIFPVTYRDELKGIVARDITGTGTPKYLNSKGRKSLYNLQPCKTVPSTLVLSEGIFKALAIERHTTFRSAALLGHSITSTMLDAIKDEGYKAVLVWPDPDAPGIRGMLDIASACATQAFRTTVIWPPPAKQADELHPTVLRNLFLNNRVPWTWALSKKIAARLAFR